MPTLILKPRRPRPRHAGAPSNPYYGHGYRPDFPSILSVAHDPADGGAVLVFADRPIAQSGGGATGLPLLVKTAGGGPIVIVSASAVLPYKWRLGLTGEPATGGAWAWPDASGDFGPVPATNFIDPHTGHPLNGGAGTIADAPGPYVPTMANVINTSYGDNGGGTSWAELTFDAPVLLASPTLSPDDAVIFGGFYAGTSVAQSSLYALRFDVPFSLSSGGSWAISRQPSWVVTGVASPQSGTF